MNKLLKTNIKLLITLGIIFLFVWFLVLSPMITFRNNEKVLENAARRYFELNSNQLPTGDRIKTVTLKTLYHKSFLEKDLYIPNTKKPCSIEDSWVKVKKVNNEYKYYVYLDCGVLSSPIDHKGPTIKLNGDEEIVVGRGEEFTDPGVKSVVDNTDGKMKTEDVVIKSDVNTSKVGEYEVKYIAVDSFSNKSTITRKVTVVQKLNSTVKQETDNVGYFTGINPKNYVYFSNMLFRIVGLDGDNVKIVADKDIANVNYDAIDNWLEYYEEHLTGNASKLIVNSKYCNMTVSDNTLDTTQCNSYTKKKKIGILSIDDINKAGGQENNYLLQNTITWLANEKDKNNAYAYRLFFFGESTSQYMSFEKVHNFGVRPVITINGNVLITGGDGSSDKPYKLEDYIEPKKNVEVNTRPVGEYINYSGYLWRIAEVNPNGTVRIICEQSLYDKGQLVKVASNVNTKKYVTYNPTQKGNVGYTINNKASEFVDTKYFVKFDDSVPIYKGEPNYGKEVDVKKYEVKITSPNMYEMFSATTDSPTISSYWFVNSTKSTIENPGMSEIGAVMYGKASTYYTYGIRPVAVLNKSCIVNSGNGTKSNPYIITK